MHVYVYVVYAHCMYGMHISTYIKGAKEMNLDGSKQLNEKTMSEIAQVKQQLEAQVYALAVH